MTQPTPDRDELLAAIESVPLTNLRSDDLVDYSITDDADGVPISTRVPASWVVTLNMIREKPGTNLPQIWPTRASFVRWCIMQGIKQVAAYAHTIDQVTDEPDERDALLVAMISVEQQAGRVAARSQTITEAVEVFETIAVGVNTNVALGEYDEAASAMTAWIAVAQEQETDYWRRVFYRIAATNLTVRPSLRTLINDAHLEDAYLSTILQQQIAREQAVATVPLTAQQND